MSREQNVQLLEELREHQAEIEGAFGGALEWNVGQNQRATRVACDLDTGGYEEVEALGDVADELLDGFLRFEKSLQPFVDRLQPERTQASGWQPRDRPWSEEEYLAMVQKDSPENATPAAAILSWAHADPRVSVQGGWGAENAGIRVRTQRPDDSTSEHSFINLFANSADNASAEVQFSSMARREPFVDRAKRIELLNQLSALSTSTWAEDDVDMRVPFRLRDLRDPAQLGAFLNIWNAYLDAFHSVEPQSNERDGSEDDADVVPDPE
jgi:hypothetical protein